MMKDKANIIIVIKYEIMYFPSNGSIANVVHPDLDLHFQALTYIFKVTKFEMLMSGKRCELFNYDFYRREYWPSSGILRMLYHLTLT